MKERFRVLVIDDRADMLELVKHTLLLQHGIQLGILEVTCLSESEQGLRLIQEIQPDVVILDDYQPMMSGGGVLRPLRALGDETPVILLTTAPMAELGDELLSMCDVYLAKPFRVSTLYDYVHVFLWKSIYNYKIPRRHGGTSKRMVSRAEESRVFSLHIHQLTRASVPLALSCVE